MHSAGHRRGAQPAALAEGPAPLPGPADAPRSGGAPDGSPVPVHGSALRRAVGAGLGTADAAAAADGLPVELRAAAVSCASTRMSPSSEWIATTRCWVSAS